MPSHEKPVECPLCCETFTSMLELAKHIPACSEQFRKDQTQVVKELDKERIKKRKKS